MGDSLVYTIYNYYTKEVKSTIIIIDVVQGKRDMGACVHGGGLLISHYNN